MTFENDGEYSVVLNLLGYDPEDIFVDIDKRNNEVGIYAKKKPHSALSVSFWIFGVPSDGQVERTAMRFKGGGLEITIPRIPVARPRMALFKPQQLEGLVA